MTKTEQKLIRIFLGQLRPDLTNELGSDVSFHDSLLDDAAREALAFEREAFNVVISRGGTAAAIKKMVTIPVVDCEATFTDLVNTLFEIKASHDHHLKDVAIISYGNIAYDIRQLSEMTDLRIKQFWYWGDALELRKRVLEVKSEGIPVMIGPARAVQIAEEIGIRGIRVPIGRETLRQAVDKARTILEARWRDLAYSEKIKTILGFTREGIILINEGDKVEYCNPRSLEILGMQSSNLIGQDVKSIFDKWDANQENRFDQILKCNGRYILYNGVSVLIDGKKGGGVITFSRSDDVEKAEEKVRCFQSDRGLAAKHRLSDIIGTSRAIKEVLVKASHYAQTDSTVLITGDTGTGKELVAHGIHMASDRKHRPFVAINCAALPESLLESELFGYVEGSFTGAKKGGRAGLIELAHRGTLFLDEIGEMRLPLQGKLLRAIHQKEVMRIGGDRIIPVDVRIIAATNRDLLRAVKDKEFRSDLYYRLNVLRLHVPSLSDRKEDIPMLIDHFTRVYGSKSKRAVPPMTNEFISAMKSYEWPGNVRELECLVQRYCLLAGFVETRSIVEFDEPLLRGDIQKNISNSIMVKLGSMTDMMDEIYSHVYKMTGENKTETARILGVNRMTVAKWLENHSKKPLS